MYNLVLIVASVLLPLHLRNIMSVDDLEDAAASVEQTTTNGGSGQYWELMKNQYIIPLGHACISYFYGAYLRLSIINVIVLIVKYVPTGLYTYKFLKTIYLASRDGIKQKQMELEDIKLQIQIVNTKICVRDAEFSEHAELLRRGAERLRLVRARVRALIDADDTLRRTLDNVDHHLETDPNVQQNTTSEQGCEFLIELLNDLKYDQNPIIERPPENMDCGENPQSEPISEHSVYSTISDGEQDCHVKIVRVTNVYKVAYLKHYIKQKRLRRANKQAILKKKIENIKKLLEDWQKSLNMVINSKLSIMNARVEDTSQEAMGDYSKPTLRESSISDTDLRTGNDLCYDEYWAQNSYPANRSYEYEDQPDTPTSREYCDLQGHNDLKYQPDLYPHYENTKMSEKLCTLKEETKSQIFFEENNENGDDDSTCHDLIKL